MLPQTESRWQPNKTKPKLTAILKLMWTLGIAALACRVVGGILIALILYEFVNSAALPLGMSVWPILVILVAIERICCATMPAIAELLEWMKHLQK